MYFNQIYLFQNSPLQPLVLRAIDPPNPGEKISACSRDHPLSIQCAGTGFGGGLRGSMTLKTVVAMVMVVGCCWPLAVSRLVLASAQIYSGNCTDLAT